jgi:methanogenic corrinoid protein MtbC1
MEASPAMAAAVSPRLLLVTLSGEKHTLGLTMIHAVLAEAGVPCVRLNSDLPVSEIVAACARHGFHAVGLSASVHYSRRLLRAQINVLRNDLPSTVELWLGGGGIDRVSVLPPGSRTFNNFFSLIQAAHRLIGGPDSFAPNA